MLQPLQQPQEAAHFPPVRDGRPGPDPVEQLQAPVHRAGAPGSPGCADEVDRDCREGTAGASAVVPTASKPESRQPLLVQAWANPSHLEALDAQCKQAERGWRLAVSLCWPLAACVTSREAQAEVHGLEE